jgi:intracellular sulfur oxidation DsrE/DsrF family protein
LEIGIKRRLEKPVYKGHGMISKSTQCKGNVCLNTANSKGVKKADMIDGIGFVTAGVTAIPDMQEEGYRYVKP